MGGTGGHCKEFRCPSTGRPPSHLQHIFPKFSSLGLEGTLRMATKKSQQPEQSRVSKAPPAPYHYYMLSATVKPWALSWVSSYPAPSLRVQMEGRPHPLPSDPVIPGYLKSCMEGPKNSLVCDRNPIMGCQALCQLALYKYEELIKPALNLIHRHL